MPIHGLTAAEVESRRAAGLTNCPSRSPTKTTVEIVRDNICTYFNLVFLVLALMLLSVGSWLNMGFLGIVFWNTLIGIIQQLRAKKTIDELTLVSAHKVRCLRDGQWVGDPRGRADCRRCRGTGRHCPGQRKSADR